MIRIFTSRDIEYREKCRLLSEHGMLYGKRIVQTELGGDQRVWESNGHLTEAEAEQSAWELALSDDWIAPKWWQFWRWSDSRPVNPTRDLVDGAKHD